MCDSHRVIPRLLAACCLCTCCLWQPERLQHVGRQTSAYIEVVGDLIFRNGVTGSRSEKAIGLPYQRPRCCRYRTAERQQCSNHTGNSPRGNTADSPTGRIPHLIHTRNRRQTQRSDRDQNVRAAGPSRRANLRHDVRRCGPFVRSRSIRVAEPFAMDVRMRESRHDCVRRLKKPGDYLWPGRVPKRRAV
jgi:hypothetical protein